LFERGSVYKEGIAMMPLSILPVISTSCPSGQIEYHAFSKPDTKPDKPGFLLNVFLLTNTAAR
jgi:hypothetical protein